MRKAKVFVINTILLTVTSLLMNIIGMSFNVYISNKIGSEAVGIYQLITSIYLFSITLATSGINIAVTHLVSEKLAKNDPTNAKKIVKQCILLSTILGILSMIILIVFSKPITTNFLHGKVSSLPLVIIAISLPPLSISSCLNGYFSAVRRVVKSASAQLIEQVFKIILSAYFISKLLPTNLENACISLVLGSLISEVISFVYLYILYIYDKRRYKSKEKSNNSFKKDILKISLPIALTSYIRSGLSTLKQIIIPLRLEKAGISCESALSKYGVIAGMVMPIIWFPCLFINVFSGLLIPEFSRYYALKNTKQINYITNRIFKITMVFSVCMFGIFYTFSDNLSIAIYNQTEIAHMIKILSPLVLIMYLDNVVDGILKGLNEQVAVMKCNILDLFISITLIYFLLPIYGIYGFIIVIFTSEILNGAISIKKLLDVTKIKLRIFDWLIKPLFCILIANWTISLFDISYNGNVLNLVFQIVLYIAIYLFILFLTSTLTKKDIKI